MLAIGLVQAGSGIMRHRFAVTNWLTAAYRTVQLVARQPCDLGGTLPRKVSTGEVVAIGTTDLSHLGQVMDVSARVRRRGRVVPAGLGDPAEHVGHPRPGRADRRAAADAAHRPAARAAAAAQRRRSAQLMGELSNTASDIVGGLRVLRGIGGEQVFLDRYRRESQTTRRAGVEVARLQSVLDALAGPPARASSWWSWSGSARGTPSQGRITPGELVAFYGYSAFLMIPLRTATEYANKLIRARVAAAPGLPGARRSSPTAPDPDAAAPPAAARRRAVRRAHRACACRAGRLTAVVCEQPDESAALADRLGPGARRTSTTTSTSAAYRSPRCAAPRCAAGSWSPTPAAALFSGRLGDRLDVTRRRRRLDRALRHGLRRGHPRRAARRAGHAGRRARAAPSPAASASAWCWPGPWPRPRGAGPGRADLRGRRPHRGPDRRPAARSTAPAAPRW